MRQFILIFLALAGFSWLAQAQGTAGEFEFVYRGDFYKKARVSSFTAAGVTVTTDRGTVTVPLNVLPFRIQDDIKARLAAQEAQRLAAQRQATAQQQRQAPVAATPLPDGDQPPEKARPFTAAVVRDMLIAGLLGVLGFFFLLGALLGSSKKFLSFVIAAICLGVGYFPGKRVVDWVRGEEPATEQAQPVGQ